MSPYHPFNFPDFERPPRSRLRALAARLAFGWKTYWRVRYFAPVPKSADVILVSPDGRTDYYGTLPALLEQRGLNVGWFTWAHLRTRIHGDDIITAVCSIPAYDAGSLDYDIPYYSLVQLATERLARKVRPKVTLCYLEHHPYARAHYEGMRRSGCGTINYAVQHSSKAPGKIGELPDIRNVSHPDFIFAMGEYSKKLFMEKCGYSEEQILVTGSPRYDYLCDSSSSVV